MAPNFARLAFASLLATAVTLLATSDGRCQSAKAKVGVLRLSSSAPVFVAQDKGYFKDAGLDIELKFFDAAQPSTSSPLSITPPITRRVSRMPSCGGRSTM